MGPISESANLPIHRAWGALRAAGCREALDATGDEQDGGVAGGLSRDAILSDSVQQSLDALLKRNRMLEAELSRQRALLQDWMLSQLTYKTLYFQYSGQSPDAPRTELMREKEMVRRRIREQLLTGGDHQTILGDQTRRLSKP